MSNMTPFEIRLELLKMAKDMLYESYNAERDRLVQDWNIKCDMAKTKGEVPPEHPPLPTTPSETEIINKAQTLNSFVSNIQQPEQTVKILGKKST